MNLVSLQSAPARSGIAGGRGVPGSKFKSAIARLNQRVRPWVTNRTVNAYALALTSPIILLLLRISLRPLLVDSGPFVFFTPAVMISAWYGGFGPGLVATVLGAALGDYFFLGPVGFDFDSASVARIVLFILVGGQISWLSGALLRAKTRLEVRVRDRTAELAFQKTLLESQSNASLDGILFASDDGKVLFHNRRLPDLWNLPAGAFSSMDAALAAMRGRMMDDVNPLVPSLADGGMSGELPPSLVLRDGRTLECYGVDVRGGEGKSYGRVWYFRDVTERRRLAKQILEAGERERQRIGLDLHDDLCPHLAGVACLARVLQAHLRQNLPAESANAARIVELVEQAVRRARDLARGLQPLQMKPDGLGTGLVQLAANVESLFGVRCTCRPADDPVVLEDTATAIHLYHIAQEAVNNAIRHGKPGEIVLELGQSGTSVELSVRDDGVGIGPNPGTGIGLQTMRHRARLVGGSLSVESGEGGNGTVVRCRLPARRSAAPEVPGAVEGSHG